MVYADRKRLLQILDSLPEALLGYVPEVDDEWIEILKELVRES